MSDRKPLMAGNWKMNHNHLEAIQVVQKLSYRLEKKDYDAVEVVVCPSFTALRSVQTTLEGDRIPIGLGAQNCYFETEGAYTGEVSPTMLAKLHVQYVIVGHSERRELFGETDDIVSKKLRAVLAADMQPIVCVGESLEQREAGETDELVAGQIRAAFLNVPAEKAERCVVAYEPIWAIGTGRTATPDDANATIGVIRSTLRDMIGATADVMRILYGGSMKPGNAADLMAMPEIDGGLVGGASLDPDDYAENHPVCPISWLPPRYPVLRVYRDRLSARRSRSDHQRNADHYPGDRFVDPHRVHSPALGAWWRPFRHVRRRRGWIIGRIYGRGAQPGPPHRRRLAGLRLHDDAAFTAPLTVRFRNDFIPSKRCRERRMARYFPRALVVAVALALTAAACGSSGNSAAKTPTSGGTSGSTAAVPQGGTVVIGAEQEPDCFDWIGQCSGSSWGTWMAQLETQPQAFRIDVEKDGSLKTVPGAVLAGMPKFQASPVETITYNINPAAVWSDGVPITCADFQYTEAQVKSGPDIYDRTGYTGIASVTCPTPKTVVVKYAKGQTFASWQQLFASAVRHPSVTPPGRQEPRQVVEGRLHVVGRPVVRQVEEGHLDHPHAEPEVLGAEAAPRQGRVPVRVRHRGGVPGVQVGPGRRDLPAAPDRRR